MSGLEKLESELLGLSEQMKIMNDKSDEIEDQMNTMSRTVGFMISVTQDVFKTTSDANSKKKLMMMFKALSETLKSEISVQS